eukprot:3477893-Rhodomonas_salina.3
MQAPAFSVQFVPGKRWIVIDFGLCLISQGTGVDLFSSSVSSCLLTLSACASSRPSGTNILICQYQCTPISVQVYPILVQVYSHVSTNTPMSVPVFSLPPPQQDATPRHTAHFSTGMTMTLRLGA